MHVKASYVTVGMNYLFLIPVAMWKLSHLKQVFLWLSWNLHVKWSFSNISRYLTIIMGSWSLPPFFLCMKWKTPSHAILVLSFESLFCVMHPIKDHFFSIFLLQIFFFVYNEELNFLFFHLRGCLPIPEIRCSSKQWQKYHDNQSAKLPEIHWFIFGIWVELNNVQLLIYLFIVILKCKPMPLKDYYCYFTFDCIRNKIIWMRIIDHLLY